MSAHAGVFYFDGRPVKPDLVASIGRSLDEFGPDGGGHLVEPGLAIVYRALHITPEDAHEKQPLQSSRGNVLTWDGRLDNRADLLFQLWRDLGEDTTDAAIALAAYERWGEAAFARLIGDWTLVVWDDSRQAIVFATDFAGNRPLYYSADAEHVVWASSLRTILELVGERDVSSEFLVGFVTSAMPPGITPYDRVSSLLPAHSMSWSRNGTPRARRTWDFPVDSIRCRDTRDYAAQLRALVAEAVQARMRSRRPVWAELSGGLDSSTLVCTAARLSHERGVTAPPLRTVSISSDESAQERRFIRDVERHCGLSGCHLSIEECFGHLDPQRHWISPLHPASLSWHTHATVRAGGGHVLLSGYLGDLVMRNVTDDSLAILEPLFNWHPVVSLRQGLAWSRACQRSIWHIGLGLLKAVAPAAVAVSLQLRAALDDYESSGHLRLRSAFSRRFLLRGELLDMWTTEVSRRLRRSRSLGPPANRQQLFNLVNVVDGGGLQASTEFPGVILTYPFAHRPLVSFVMALPAGVLARPGEPRSLMRKAFADVLPTSVVRRISKGRAVDPFRVRAIRAFADRWRDRVDELWLVKHGCADEHVLREELQHVHARGPTRRTSLWQMVLLESWLSMAHARRDGVQLALNPLSGRQWDRGPAALAASRSYNCVVR